MVTASIMSLCDIENSQISRHIVGVVGDDIMFHMIILLCVQGRFKGAKPWRKQIMSY